MWQYEKKLQFPINIKRPNPKLANFIISQYGGAYCKCLSSLANGGSPSFCVNLKFGSKMII